MNHSPVGFKPLEASEQAPAHTDRPRPRAAAETITPLSLEELAAVAGGWGTIDPV
ncbi:MAG: hypothetical protein ACKOPN_12180 [Prochlorococcaceae cyanobacterium]